MHKVMERGPRVVAVGRNQRGVDAVITGKNGGEVIRQTVVRTLVPTSPGCGGDAGPSAEPAPYPNGYADFVKLMAAEHAIQSLVTRRRGYEARYATIHQKRGVKLRGKYRRT